MLFLGEKVNNEIEAYILGLIYADGTIVANGQYKAYRTMNILLQKRDEPLLFELNKYLKGNIKYYIQKLNEKEYPCVRLSKYSIDFVNKIRRLGIEPNKTYSDNTFIFDNIPLELKWHFIRGYFDGDGCITTVNSGTSYIVEFACHSKIFLENLHSFIKSQLFTLSNVTKGDGVYRIRYGGNIIVNKLKQMMYNQANIYLKRKYDIFNQVIHRKEKSKYKYISFASKNTISPWVIRINDKRYGCFETEKKAVDYYNNIIVVDLDLPIQKWEGESNSEHILVS